VAKPKQPKTKLLRIRADELAIHPTAQRAIVKAHLKYLTEKLDLDALGTLHAVKYPIKGVEKLWIVDGQHRWQALIDNGFGEWIVDVMVHLDIVDDVGANKVFLKLNTRKGQTAFERFAAGVRAKFADEVSVANVCRNRGLKIKPGTADGCVACVGTLLDIQRHDSGRTLHSTLDVIKDAWGYVSASLEGVIVSGLARVLIQHAKSIEIAVLVQKLAKYPGGAGALHGDAKGRLTYTRISVSRCVSVIIIETYNSGRRSGKL
jgi:hypothetical protein